MPTSRKKGDRDFSDCKFRTLLTNLPPAIQHMLDRALGSFGTDVNVLPRWNGPVVKKDGSTVLEKDYFPHNPSIQDICCADGVAFCLYQSGVVDLGRNPDYFRARMMNGKSMAGCYHWAHYYYAHEGNADVCYELPKLDNRTDPATVDFRDWLPGDVFVFFNDEKGDPEGDHVNIYLGPFTEVADGQDVGPVYHFFNSSIGTTGGNAFCTASPLKNQLAYCKSVNRSIVRVRVRAIEQLFRNQVGAPIVLADSKPDPKAPPRAETAWRLAEAGAAPYPVGRGLTWHEGIHLVSGAGLKNDSVEVFAPGELVLVRFGEPTSAGDSSFVLARHRMVTSQVKLLPPPPITDEAKQQEEKADPSVTSAKQLYSLYMQLAPLTRYLDEAHEIEPGIPALFDGTTTVPAGKAVAPEWLRRLWLERKPELIDLVPDTAPLSVLALTRNNGTAAFSEIGRADRMTARKRFPLSELTSVTISGTQYWLLPLLGQSNAGVWDQKIPPATVPRQRKLVYYNPRTGSVITTALNVPGTTPLVHRDQDGASRLVRVLDTHGAPVTAPAGTLIRIRAHDTPGIQLASFVDQPGERDQYDYDESERLLTFHENVKRITLYTTTAGEGDKRYFPDETQLDLAKATTDRTFTVRERADTGSRTKISRAWVDLPAGVLMTDAEIQAAETLLNDRDTALRTQIQERLSSGRSGLAGVKTSPKSGWEMKDGHLVAAAEPPEGGLLTIYRKIKGTGATRSFEEPPPKAELEQEQDFVLEIPPPPASATIYPLLTPVGRTQSAVFELMLATSVKGDNQADIDAIDAANRAKKPLVQKLLRHELVDLRAELQSKPELRNVNRERIGEMGDVLSASGSLVKGLHFELFAGENIVDPNVAGTGGAIVPVPKTPWLVYKDGAADGFFSSDFVGRVVTLLREQALTHGIDLRALDTAFGEDGVVQPEEWVEFCRTNHRPLSRLITVHKPEWKTDWTSELNSSSRGGHSTQAQRDALAHDVAQMHWWKDDLSLEGISSDDVFFYHPLRFIEWLGTGIDFVVNGIDKKKPKVKVRPLEGGDEVELTADARDPSLFRFRTFVGEGGAKNQAPFRVTLENVSTATPQFSVMIKRGEVHVVRLLEPSVVQDYANPHESIGGSYAVPVRLGDARNGYLLADGTTHIEGSGYDETSIVLKVSYNVRIPGNVTLKLEGDASFVMGKPDVSGAKIGSSSVSTRQTTLVLTDDQTIAPAVEASIVEGARMYTVRVDVKTTTTDVDRSAKLVATVEGGDLPAQRKIELPIATRTISTSGRSSAKGEDVAKLQLYLSQIHAADDQPCLRAGKGSVLIDGSYGGELASAIWRFVYTYGRTSDWSSAAWPIATTKADGSAGVSGTQQEVAGVSVSVLEGSTPKAAIEPANGFNDLFAKRVGRYEKRYDHYPVVGKPLIQEITKRFRPPFVLPHIDVYFENTALGAAPAGVTIDDDWNRDGRIGKSTVLPLLGDLFVFRVAWPDASAERHGDMSIVLSIPDGAAYKFGNGQKRMETTLRDALRTERYILLSAESISTKATDNLLSVTTTDGRIIGQRQLHGSRDLTKAQAGDGCRDAAWMQLWLSAIPDQTAEGQMVYKNTRTTGKGAAKVTTLLVDGKWNKASADALARFKAQYAPAAATFADLVTAVRSKYYEVLRAQTAPAP
ncbi:MAG: hypothetical protein K8H88_25870 [Sandaracinaceae bacterium]|nr:hypothetical protein [Sandaracinaceae bacterium]